MLSCCHHCIVPPHLLKFMLCPCCPGGHYRYPSPGSTTPSCLFPRQAPPDTLLSLLCCLPLQRFNSWLDRASLAAHSQNLLVYPEGTRSLRQVSLPLKRGMLRYAYTRRLPVQVGQSGGSVLPGALCCAWHVLGAGACGAQSARAWAPCEGWVLRWCCCRSVVRQHL